jgi:regulatory protein
MSSARERALSYLGRFARTEQQVADYLKRKGFPPEEIAQTIEYLRERSFVNDSAFAESYIQSRIRHGDGPLKIKQLLFQKGIAPADADLLLRELYPADAQLLRVIALIRQKSGLDRNKTMRFLASRGFPHSIIYQGLRQDSESK